MSAKDDIVLITGPIERRHQELAYRPERLVVVELGAAGPAQPDFDGWTIELGEPISLMHPSLIEGAYAHRGRRYIGRKIRQQRRMMRRVFGPPTKARR